jgi:IPT/TIG domain
MRLLGLFLVATLLLTGCGTGHGGDPGLKTSGFLSPSITELVPNSVPVNSPPFMLTVNGTNFGPGAMIFWNGNPHTTFLVSQNQLTTTLTDTDLMFVGLAHVLVRTGGLNSNTVDFNVTPE